MASSMFFIPPGGGVTEQEVEDLIAAENALRDNTVLSNNWMDSNTNQELHSSSSTGTTASSNTEAFCCYIKVGKQHTFDNLAVQVSTSVASSALKFAVYTLTSDFKPKTKIAESAEVASTSTGVKTAALTSFSASGWIAVAMSATSNSIGIRHWDNTSAHFKLGGDVSNVFTTTEGVNGCKFTHVAGTAGAMNAFPADAESAFAGVVADEVPRVLLQVA